MNQSSTPLFTVGMDLGDRWSMLCVLDQEGSVAHRGRVATRSAAIQKLFAQWPGARVAMETGTHSPWISRLLAEHGFDVFVANARRIALISRNDRKTDEMDAELLARLGRSDPGLLFAVRHRSEAAARDLAVIRGRSGLVTARAKLVNAVRGIAKSFGVRLHRCSTRAFARETIPDQLKDALNPMMDAIASLSEQIKLYDQQIKALCKKYPQTQLLQQVQGVGSLTALTFFLTLEDVSRFPKSRQVGAYLGLTPGKKQSGDRDPKQRITKAGDPVLRSLLVQCAHYILGPFGKDSDLRRFGLRLAPPGQTGQKKKAVVAVARKLAVLLVSLWRTGEVYEPLRNSKTALAA